MPDQPASGNNNNAPAPQASLKDLGYRVPDGVIESLLEEAAEKAAEEAEDADRD